MVGAVAEGRPRAGFEESSRESVVVLCPGVQPQFRLDSHQVIALAYYAAGTGRPESANEINCHPTKVLAASIVRSGEHCGRRDHDGLTERWRAGDKPARGRSDRQSGPRDGHGRKDPGGERRWGAALLAKTDDRPDRSYGRVGDRLSKQRIDVVLLETPCGERTLSRCGSHGNPRIGTESLGWAVRPRLDSARRCRTPGPRSYSR